MLNFRGVQMARSYHVRKRSSPRLPKSIRSSQPSCAWERLRLYGNSCNLQTATGCRWRNRRYATGEL